MVGEPGLNMQPRLPSPCWRNSRDLTPDSLPNDDEDEEKGEDGEINDSPFARVAWCC